MSFDILTPKDFKKSMQANWSDKTQMIVITQLLGTIGKIKNDYLAFIAFVYSEHDIGSDCDCNDKEIPWKLDWRISMFVK